MFDNLREQMNSSPSPDEDAKVQASTAAEAPLRRGPGKFLGMTAQQRFLISVIMMIMVCIMGALCLLVTGRIGLF